MKRFIPVLTIAALAVIAPTYANAATRIAPTGGSASFTTPTTVVGDLGCFGFDTCNEVIALCIGGGHEYHGDSDQGWCDTNDNGKNDGHSG